jgi:hypothetical protein
MDTSMGMPDSDNSETGTLEYAIALTGTAHLMADYLLSSDTVLQDFCQFYADGGLPGHEVPRPTDDEIQGMSDALTAAHDTFAAMSARAQAQLLLSRLAGNLNDDAGPSFMN